MTIAETKVAPIFGRGVQDAEIAIFLGCSVMLRRNRIVSQLLEHRVQEPGVTPFVLSHGRRGDTRF